MRTIAALMGLLLISCYSPVRNVVQSQESHLTPDEVYAEAIIETGKLSLVNRGGRCVLRYERAGGAVIEGKTETDARMAGPCNFVRRPGGDHAPLYYVYRKGADRRTVLLVVGGPPDSSMKDEFLPAGCGTILAKVRVFADRVEVVRSGETGLFPVCPSGGADEVYFGT